MNKIRS